MNERDLFMAALQIEDAAERSAYLDRACAGETALRQRVEALLAALEQAGSFLQQPAGDPRAAPDATQPGPSGGSDPAEGPGTVIGPYKLLEQIGEGGMGTVWMAQQTEPIKRLVAVKLIKAGMDSHQVIARFEAERQALALMDHPNIARVLDGGTTSAGRPYFVMDLVRGVPITRYCDEHRLTPRQRLGLFVPVCQAVQHAHQKGLIHRDLKPSNVLVAQYDGRPVPKVIDFGVAKAAGQTLTDKTLVTGFGSIVGTLEYMSPEQAELNQLDIDTRSDVYSLGVLLYELLAGSPPFTRKESEKGGVLEMLRMIREQEPTKPSAKLSTAEGLPTLAANRGTEPAKLTKLVRGELDWIVMKALEKDRNRRYDTANGFARDVRRYLADEPVLACPPSAWYRFRKFARRNRAHLAVAAALGLLPLGAGAFAWHADRQAAQRRTEAEIREREEQARLGRNAEAVAVLLKQCEDALGADRADRATIALEAAERRAAEGGAEELAARMARCRNDLKLLSELNETDTLRWTIAEGKLPDLAADAARWRLALGAHGMIPPAGGSPTDAAGRVNGSLVRDRVLTALDLLLDAEPSAEVRAVLRAADPDAYREAVRDAQAARDARAVRALAAKPEALTQPARFADVLGQLGRVPRERRRTVLDNALRARPWDLGLLMARGNSYRGERESAAERARWFQAAVAAHPENVAAHNNLGVALAEQRNFDAAIAEYEEAIRLAPAEAAAHVNLGASLAKKRNPDGAIAEYREALRLDPKSAGALTNWGRALAAKKDLEGAIAKHLEAIGIDENFASAHNNLGLALSAKGDLKGAVTQYKEAIRLDRENAAGPVTSWGVALWKQNDLDGALAKYEEALRIDPNDAPAHTNRGVILWGRGKRDAALAEFREGVRLDSEDVHAQGGLGTALVATGDPAGALPHLQKAVQLDPESGEYRGSLAVVLAQLGRLDDAITEFEKAIGINPDFTTRNNFAITLRKHGKLDRAIPLLTELATEIEKGGFRHENAEAIVNDLIDCHERLKQFAPAETWRRKLLAAVKEQFGGDSPRFAAQLVALGRNLHKQQKWAGAIEAYQKALAINPQGAGAWSGLGLARADSNDVPGAIAAYKKAVAIDPQDAGVWNNLGAVLKADKDLPGATDAFKKALAIDDQYATAWANLGIALNDSKDVPGAIAAYKKAVAIDGQYAMPLNGLAWILATCADGKLRDPGLAVDLAKRAVGLAPKDPNYPSTLGAAHYRNGDWKAAIAALEKSMEMRKGGDSFEWFFLAMAHRRLGEKDKARAWYDRAVTWMDRNQPTNEELRRFRAEAEELLRVKERKD